MPADHRSGPKSGYVILLCVLMGAACNGAPALPKVQPIIERVPAEEDTLQPVAIEAPIETPEDREADVKALEAIKTLEFTSLAKNPGHVGTMEAARPVASGWPPAPPRGGVASSTSPAFDIEVEPFAGRRRVRYYMDFFLGPSRDRFTIWLGRLNRYEGMIRAVLRSRGVPEDLVYLGLIESGYSNSAVSMAYAVGMWQFMAPTARRYGLTVDDWVDERQDPFKATDAAARHLNDLYEQFGSWYLAAAAYNGGAGRISRGIRRLRGADSLSEETFFRLSNRRYLRRETRDYVPKLIAAAIIAKDPLKYGFDSIPYLYPLAFDEITVTGATGLDVIARLADTTTQAILELNPQYYRGITPPKRRAVVRVPKGRGPIVTQRYAALPARDRVNFLEHKIRRGETLGLVARRYRVSVELLIAANPGIRPRRLKVGQRIQVPLSQAARKMGRLRPVGRRYRARVPSSGYHRVRPGESLSVLAARYGVSVRDLMVWNGIRNGDVLRAGKTIRVVPRRRSRRVTRALAPKNGRHTVRWGETLWIIAQKYGVTIQELRRWNALAKGTPLVAGTVLRVTQGSGQ